MRSYLGKIIAVLIVVSVIIPAGSPIAVATEQPSLTFQTATTSAERGDIASIEISTIASRTTLLTIRGATVNYKLQTAIKDVNNDGKLTVHLNTHLAGRTLNSERVLSAVGVDRVEYVTRPTPRRSEPLPVGRYNLIATVPGYSVAGTLRLTNGSVGSGAVYTASSPQPTDKQISSTPALDAEIAYGDYAVTRFDVSGIGALISDAPVNNMIYPLDSTPTAETTHRIRLTPTEEMDLRTVTIDYDAGDEGVPVSIRAETVRSPTIIGIDENDDGIIDHRLNRTPSVSVREREEMRIRFETPIKLQAGDDLYLRVPMRNPSLNETDAVSVTLNHNNRINGEVTYGIAGAGTLGYGVDLRANSPNRTVVNSLAGARIRYDNISNTLTVTRPTSISPSTLSYGQSVRYTYSLRFLSEYPYGNTSFATSSFIVTPPRATIRAPQPSARIDTREIMVRATTNLAPQRTVRLHIDFNTSSTGAITMSVTRDQRIVRRVFIPEVVMDEQLRFQILYKGTAISLPVSIQYRPDKEDN